MNLFKVLLLTLVFCLDCIIAKDLKTLVLIIASDDKPFYCELQKVWRAYMHSDQQHFKCYFVKAGNDLDAPIRITEDTIWTNTKEQYKLPGLLDKTIVAIETLLKEDQFDFVFRANISSFLVFPRLLNFLNQLPKENCYAGLHHGLGSEGITNGWICGAGIIMSKDVAKVVVENKKDILVPKHGNNFEMDDVAIAQLCQSLNIKPISGPAREIYSLAHWEHLCRDPSQYYHVRFKIDVPNRDKYELPMQKILLKHYYNVEI